MHPWVLAYVIDNVIPAGEPEADLFMGRVMVYCSLAGGGFYIIANRMASRCGQLEATQIIRHDLFCQNNAPF